MDNHARLFVNLCLLMVLSIVITGCLPLFEFPPDVGGLTTNVEGRVVNFYTNEGIMGIPILIEDEDSEADPWEWSNTYYDTTYTDSIGFYAYEFINEVGRRYTIRPQSTALYYNQHKANSIVEGKLNSYSFIYKPYSNLFIHIVNKFKVWPHFFISNHTGEYTYSEDINLGGFDVDTIFQMRFVPDQYIELHASKNDCNIGMSCPNYKHEEFNLKFNYKNKDTTMLIEY